MEKKIARRMLGLCLLSLALGIALACWALWPGAGGPSALPWSRLLPALAVAAAAVVALALWLSRRLTRSLLRPIERLELDDPEEALPYPELEPLAQSLRARQAEKQAGERMRRDFTANVTHELKTPLTSISGYAEMIQAGMVHQADIATFAGKIHQEAARLIRLIGDILQLSQLDDPAAPKALSAVDLKELAQATARRLDFAAQKAEVTLTVAGEAVAVMGDRAMLEELVYNLCDNALRYNRPGGSVTVVTGHNVQGPWLRVSDTGIGIPPAHQPRVFERFYRVDKSRSRDSGGTGLGLAIVKHVALQHGAELALQSREGRGTSILVRFPPPAPGP